MTGSVVILAVEYLYRINMALAALWMYVELVYARKRACREWLSLYNVRSCTDCTKYGGIAYEIALALFTLAAVVFKLRRLRYCSTAEDKVLSLQKLVALCASNRLL